VKSVGHEETFAVDLTERDSMELVVVRLAERVALRLRRAGLVTRTVVLKARDGSFRTVIRSRTLAEATDLGADLVGTARALLTEIEIGRGIRLLGVTAQHLESRHLDVGIAVQETLALDAEPVTTSPRQSSRTSRRALERAMDQARERFGDDAVIPARLAASPETPIRPSSKSSPPSSAEPPR
jgi:DNA polymerase-4